MSEHTCTGQYSIPHSCTETSFVSEDTSTGQSYISHSITQTSFVSEDTCNEHSYIPHSATETSFVSEAGRDFSGEPGIQAPRKSLKLTGNPCWNFQFLHFK